MIYRKLTTAEYADLQNRILYEDNHLLIVNKKVGEIAQGDKTGDETITDLYKAFIAMRDNKPGSVFLGVPHRLDRPVSGIIILAKTSKALERLNEKFRKGEVSKIYWALTYNAPETPQGLLEGYLYRNEAQNKSYMCREGQMRKDAKLARLEYRLIGHTDRYHIISVRLMTGRHHQIRCQLANMGCIIKGDMKYGAPRSNPDGGICLHSREVTLIHPVKKTELKVTAPLPASWKGIPQELLSTSSQEE